MNGRSELVQVKASCGRRGVATILLDVQHASLLPNESGRTQRRHRIRLATSDTSSPPRRPSTVRATLFRSICASGEPCTVGLARVGLIDVMVVGLPPKGSDGWSDRSART
jgi:hypothetical protein